MVDALHRSSIRLSVVIPTLNEEEAISECVSQVRRLAPDVETIVADAGSTDKTVQRALDCGALACRSPRGRGKQCNAGAAMASGDVIVFLHADTRLPPQALGELERIFRNRNVNLGTFHVAFDRRHWFLTLFCLLSRFDPGIFRFGDQCIVVRKSFFQSLGGFAEYDLFEDMDFVLRARKATRVRRFSMTVTTSARRFVQNGIVRQQMRNVWLTVLFLTGASPDKLAARYAGVKTPATAAVVVMARLPEPGKVKTRLARSIGEEAATEVYRLCAEGVFEQVRRASGETKRYIFYADRQDGARMKRWAGDGFRFCPQSDGDLGERLEQAFNSVFRRGAKKAVVIASDVPNITAVIIDEAMRILDRHDLVIGPSHDGGYYLIGMNRLYRHLFRGMAWSTQQVLRQTVGIAEPLGLRLRFVPALADIDNETDLHEWAETAGNDQPLKIYVESIRPAGR